MKRTKAVTKDKDWWSLLANNNNNSNFSSDGVCVCVCVWLMTTKSLEMISKKKNKKQQ